MLVAMSHPKLIALAALATFAGCASRAGGELWVFPASRTHAEATIPVQLLSLTWKEVLTYPRALSLFSLEKEVVVAAAATPLLVCHTDGECRAPADAAAQLRPPQPMTSARITAMGGRWPQAVWLTRSLTVGEGREYETYRLRNGRWVEVRRAGTPFYVWYLQITAWGKRVLGLASFQRNGLAAGHAHRADRPPPHERLLVVEGTRAHLPPIATNVSALQVLALPGGELLLLGERVEGARGETVVQRWRRGRLTSSTLPLPASCSDQARATLDPKAIDGPSASGAFVAGRVNCDSKEHGYLARLIGDRWRSLESPVPREIHSISVQADQTLWAASDELWRRSPGGAWARAALPAKAGARCRPLTVRARGADDLLVLAACATAQGAISVVYRTALQAAAAD
jgi:hypothetical protein